MELIKVGKILTTQLLVMVFIISGCMPEQAPSTRSSYNSLPSGASTSGSGAGAEDSTSVGSGTSLPPKVEIRHLIEPNLSTDLSYNTGTGYAGGGSYVRKLTLPKNFSGRLYVAGINVGTLSNRHVKVRFKFGVGKEPITVPATIVKAPGITPSTNVDVLVLDLRSEPFRNIRLPYDLFDYNDYDFSAGDTPTQDNRDSGLYCRGLKVADDPTFSGVGACDGVQSNSNQPEEECLYAYAKVLDQGLVKESSSVLVPISPGLAQVKSITGSSYFQDYLSQQLLKPLRDTIPTTATNVIGSYKFSEVNATTGSQNITFTYPTSIWDPATISGTRYYYRGPYRLVNTSGWEFKFAELDGPKRLFRQDSWVGYPIYFSNPLPDDNQSSPTQTRLYYNSYLFPLATQLQLNANVTHLSSSTVTGVRTENTLSTAGTTLWMDGSNARAQSKNTDLEHIGSCNVSSTLEIIAKDNNNVDYVVSIASDVKLQLVRPTQFRTDTGNEVLYTNFKSCSTNSACGGSECCFNNRCWDQSLVSQCYDSTTGQGNRNVGDTCTSDLECTSLCCNRTSGLCAPHNTLLNPAVLCSKPVGDFCIAKDWCQKSPVVKCLVIKTGTDSLGNTTCRQHCYNTEEFGDCKSGVCTPPVQPAIPTFDPNATGACNNAVDAPSF